jgi:hypothetical protein
MTAPQPKHSYLVHLLDAMTLEEGLTVVQASSTDGIQELLQGIAHYSGGLLVGCSLSGENDLFTMHNPVVMHIDAETAAHIPLVDPVN